VAASCISFHDCISQQSIDFGEDPDGFYIIPVTLLEPWAEAFVGCLWTCAFHSARHAAL